MMSAMTTPLRATPLVADGEMPFTPWDQINVRSGLFNVYRTILPPEGAREWLTHNLVNRRLEPATVQAYRRLVRAGEMLPIDPFLFCSPSGVISGAHRMTAIELEGRPVEVLVHVGNSEQARWVVDTHRYRQHAQNLAMRGVVNPRFVSALAAAVWRFEEFGYIRSGGPLKEKPLHAELDDVLAQHPEIQRFAEIAWQTSLGLKRKETPTVLGLALWMMAKGLGDPGAAIEFMRQLEFEPEQRPLAVATEEDVPEAPAVKLRRRLVSPGYSRSGRSELTRVTQIIEAWNAWVAGDTAWMPPNLEQAGSVPKALCPGWDYPKQLREPAVAPQAA